MSQPESTVNGSTTPQFLPPANVTFNHPQHPFSSAPNTNSQQQPQGLMSQSQSVMNGSITQQYFPPSNVSFNRHQPPISNPPNTNSQQQPQGLMSQSIMNGSTTQQYLPTSNVSQHPHSSVSATNLQQLPLGASKLPPKVALVNPQGLSKLSIAPSPYANMYKKPKPSVSNVPANSPWHRNSETNSSPFEKK
uniref:Uncharacterized protein n=1 Tax=Panagrolaimus superbus TaxID=310955 RepID=A0A914Z7V4_9BILA